MVSSEVLSTLCCLLRLTAGKAERQVCKREVEKLQVWDISIGDTVWSWDTANHMWKMELNGAGDEQAEERGAHFALCSDRSNPQKIKSRKQALCCGSVHLLWNKTRSRGWRGVGWNPIWFGSRRDYNIPTTSQMLIQDLHFRYQTCIRFDHTFTLQWDLFLPYTDSLSTSILNWQRDSVLPPDLPTGPPLLATSMKYLFGSPCDHQLCIKQPDV